MTPFKWRNPNKELPPHGTKVWVMVEPHKNRGTIKKSVMSIEICCGQVDSKKEGFSRIENNDELGMGNMSWDLIGKNRDILRAIAWIPVEEMPLPDWK